MLSVAVIRVYLDSSDYSVMSDPRHVREAGVYQYLQEKIETGVIEIRFSAFHPLESAHVDARAKPMAIRRAEAIQALSGNKCFVWWSDLMNAEALGLASGVKLAPDSYTVRDDGRWFPCLDDIAGGMKGLLDKELRSELALVPLPRNQKRQVRSKLFRNGRLTKTAIDLITPGRQAVLDKLREQFPLPHRAFNEDIFLKIALGELHSKHLANLLEGAFADLPTFVGWAYDKYDQERKLTSWLRDGSYIRVIEEIRAEVDSLVERGIALGVDPSAINKYFKPIRGRVGELRERVLWSIYSEVREERRKRGIDRKTWEQRVIKSTLGSIPSLDTTIEVSLDYFASSSMIAPQRRSLLASDYGDIMHMTYMPYVDLFRCDGYASNLAGRAARRYGTKIVSKLSELPTAIDNALGNKYAGGTRS